MKARSFYIFVFIYMLAATRGDCAPASPAAPVLSAMTAVQPIKIAGTPIATSTKVPPSKPNTSPNKTDGKDVCLGCHGPFNDLIAAAITFTAENGEKINPHRHVPHNRTDAKALWTVRNAINCIQCHWNRRQGYRRPMQIGATHVTTRTIFHLAKPVINKKSMGHPLEVEISPCYSVESFLNFRGLRDIAPITPLL